MLLHYLSTAARNVRRSPYIAAVNILGIALGLACFIGAYAAVRYIESSDRQFATAARAYAVTATETVVGYPIVRISATQMPQTLRAIEAAWDRLIPGRALQRRFVDEQFELNYRLFERIHRVISGVAIMAFAISLMGLAGMGMFVANRRRHEIGVRKTLGAGVGQIVRMLLRDFSAPIVLANIAVWPLGYLAANAYLNVFAHRSSLTILPFLLSLIATVSVAWLAVGGHAFRAARLKPATVLRYE